ncbi:alpha/beta fold hydrolase [Tabrizicola sp.]|uniref:alpha/beta fold hydrolase n=1 Tax=Tabrizicola sp. TaxID=2005166 RepID=UPI003F32FC1F
MTRLMATAALLMFTASNAVAEVAPPTGFTSAMQTTGDVKLHYVRDGGPGETVILLHGFPQTWSSWVKMMPLLSAEYDVIAVDLRGVGGSDKPKDGYDKKTSAGDIKALMDELGIASANIVGHDIGGMIAYSFAAQFPDMAQSITIMDVPLPGTPIYDAISKDPRAWHFGFHADPVVPEALITGREEFYYGNFMQRVDAGAGVIGAVEIAEAVAAYSVPETATAGFNWFRTFPQDVTDNTEYMKTKLEMPVLGLNAGRLMNMPYIVEMMTPLATTVEGQAMDSGHWIPETVPEETVAILDQFFKKY